MPVWTAFVERTLPLADPRWLAQLASGQKWLRVSGIVLVAMVIVSAVRFLPAGSAWGDRVGLGSLLLALAAATIATWKLSAPNPADPRGGGAGGANHALIARIALLITLIGSSGAVAIGMTFGFGPTATIFALAASPFGVSGGVFFIALAHSIERVASLAGDTFGASRIRSYRRGFSVCWSVFLGSALFTPAVACLGFPLLFSAFGVLGFGLLIVLSPTYFAEHLREARRLAELLQANPQTVLADVVRDQTA